MTARANVARGGRSGQPVKGLLRLGLPRSLTGRATSLSLLGTAILSAAPAASADGMSVGFSWTGMKACVEEAASPAFTVQGTPAGTRFLIFSLTDPDKRQGRGQYVNFPSDGIVLPGAVSFMPPCAPGLYRWSVIATDQSGHILDKADVTKAFPP